MHRSIKMIMMLAILSLATFVVMAADDTDADPAIEYRAREITASGVQYDLCYQEGGVTYGEAYIAFVTGGSVTSINENCKYSKPELRIDSKVTFDSHDYTVVGIRNNAFQASLHPEKYTENIETVYIPETMVAIGVDQSYLFKDSTSSYCFSGCINLKDLIIEGDNPQLKQISIGAFKNVSLEVLDLSNCTNMEKILPRAFENVGLELIDIRHVNEIKDNAFIGCGFIKEIVMPEPPATINIGAFDMPFYDEQGNPITSGAGLVGKSFKVDDQGHMKQGYLATFNSNGGSHVNETIYFAGEKITKVSTKHDSTFYAWTKGGVITTHMPQENAEFDALWQIAKPTSKELVYNKTNQTAYSDTDGYTVTGATGTNANDYVATFTLKPNTVWADDHSAGNVQVPWKILQREITISGIDAKDKNYDNTTNAVLDLYGVNFDGIIDGDVLTVSAIGTFDKKDAGDRTVNITNLTLGGTDVANYKLKATGQQTSDSAKIFQINATVTAKMYTKTYGESDPTFEVKISGILEGDTFTPSYTLERTGDQNVGHHPIIVSGTTNQGNYHIIFENGNLEITKKELRITADNHTKHIDSDDPDLTAQVEGLVQGDTISYTLERAPGEGLGSYIITLSNISISDNYNCVYMPGFLTIIDKDYAIIALDQQAVYGEEEKTLTYLIEGSGTQPAPTSNDFTISREPGTGVGEYTITVALKPEVTRTDISLVNGVYKILPKDVKVLSLNKTKNYGDDDPTFEARAVGLVGTDTLTYTFTRTQGENVGSYEIQVTAAASPNYTYTYEYGHLAIEQRQVIVVPDDKTKTYGDSDPTLTAVVQNLKSGDTVAYTLTREKGDDANSYKITASGKENQGNYLVKFSHGVFKIESKHITVTADNKEKGYGEEDPEFTATVTGLVGKDTVQYKLECENDGSVGTHTIVVSGEQHQSNYIITFINGTLTISPQQVTVTADNKYKAFGEDDPGLTVTYTGLKEGDTIAYTIYRQPGEAMGTYDIIVSGESNQGKYQVTFVNGTFTITGIPVYVVADDKSKYYGEEDPELTATVSGTEFGDEVEYYLYRYQGEEIGSYEIVPAGESRQGIYDVIFISGELTIMPYEVTVKADDITKVKGDSDPTLTATITGTSPGGKIDYTISREPGESVGTYVITVDGDPYQDRYHVTFVDGTFTITEKLYSVNVIVDGKGTASASVSQCAAGTKVTLTQTADDGWNFKGWRSDQVTIEENSFIMPEGNVTITAEFDEDNTTLIIVATAIAVVGGILAVAGVIFLRRP